MNWDLPKNKEKLFQSQEKWDTVGVTPVPVDNLQGLKTVYVV